VNLSDAATYTGLGKSTLRRLEADDEIPTIHVGRRLLFDISDLDAFMLAHRRPARHPTATAPGPRPPPATQAPAERSCFGSHRDLQDPHAGYRPRGSRRNRKPRAEALSNGKAHGEA
jgi:excisionase family DNA binding protein